MHSLILTHVGAGAIPSTNAMIRLATPGSLATLQRVRLGFLLIAACGSAEAPPPEAAAFRPPAAKAVPVAASAPVPSLVAARELFEHPEWIGTSKWVDLYDPMYDENSSSVAPHGGYDVEVADGGRLELIAGTDAPALKKLYDRHVPIRVWGEVQKAQWGLRLVASQYKALDWPKPEKLSAAVELVRDRTKWSDRYVQVEDDYLVGFEASLLGQGVWLSWRPGIVVHCEPKRDDKVIMDHKTYRVRVTGFAHTRHRYGHLGMRNAEIVATEVTFIDPKRGCN
jgi:hypothetical protein